MVAFWTDVFSLLFIPFQRPDSLICLTPVFSLFFCFILGAILYFVRWR